MKTITEPQITQSDFQDFLVAWKRLKDQGGSIADLTYPPLVVHNPLCVRKQQEEGLCMIGSVRGKGKCKSCGGKWVDTGKALGCPKCFTTPEKYLIDFHWKGKRIRLFKDKQGYTLDSYQRALRMLEKIRSEIDEGKFDPTFYIKADKHKFIFTNYMWSWYELTKDNVAPSTQLRRKKLIKGYYVPFFGEQDIREIRAGDIAKFLKSLTDKNLSSKYIDTILVSLHKIFADAYSWEDIEKIPVFPKIEVSVKPFKWIDRETQNSILDVIKPENKPIFQFLFLSGCRISEVTALKWDCVNLKDGVILIKRTHSAGILRDVTKTNNWRLIPMSDELKSLIETQKQKTFSINGFVFINPWGREYNYNNLWKIWNRASTEKGIDVPPYNATRHSWASQRINAGFTRDEIGAVMGHRQLQTTKKYTRILTENLKAVMDGEKVVSINSHLKKIVTKSSPGDQRD